MSRRLPLRAATWTAPRLHGKPACMRIPLEASRRAHQPATTPALRALAVGRTASNVRFRFGRAQVIGGWESLTASPLTGVCRAAFPWTDNSAGLSIALGTHSKLQLWQGGGLFDITPASGFTPGAIDGAGSAGYGTGGSMGSGGFGQPSATDYFPLTWSFGAWGQNLVASPAQPDDLRLDEQHGCEGRGPGQRARQRDAHARGCAL